MSISKKEPWQKFIDSLPFYQSMPPGFLTLTDYGKRMGTAKQGIMAQVRSGSIPREHCIAVATSTDKRRLAIDWNKTAYEAIMQKHERHWPDDFEPNEARLYKPLEVEVQHDGPRIITTTGGSEYDSGAVVDLASAKLRSEILKIAKSQAELDQANNKTILLEDAVATQKEIALELKAALIKAENKMAPLLLQAKSILDIRAIMKAHHREALEVLNPDRTEEDFENDGEEETTV